MKKRIKQTLLLGGLIVLLAAGAAAYNFYPLLAMKPAETGTIANTNISALRNNRNALYFAQTDTGYIMVDAGSDAEKVKADLPALDIDTNDVRWILITHSDYDHVAALSLFPNAEIYINEDEFNSTAARSKFGAAHMPAGINADAVHLLRDGQRLSLGTATVTCVKAPGHTIGSMVYLVDGKYLFTGDAFQVRNGKIGVHPFTVDARRGRETIEALKETLRNSAVVLTSHYGYYENLLFELPF
ncbi:MAG: MBL fold metallo-hydrolase [Firmicutes bacterium]|nr:MBL fold metallo-hydrolase [Bacillota bacterium]